MNDDNQPTKAEAVRLLIEAIGDARRVLELVGEEEANAKGRLAQRLANRLKLTEELFTEELDARKGLYNHIEGAIGTATGFLLRLGEQARSKGSEGFSESELFTMPALNLADAWNESQPFWKNAPPLPPLDDEDQENDKGQEEQP